MKFATRNAWVAALATLALAPASVMACEDYDASSAAATPASLMAATPPPAASKVPATAVVKAVAPVSTKQTAVKAKASAAEQTVAVSSTR